MLNKYILSGSVPVVHPTDSVSQVLGIMEDELLTALPVVAEEQWIGLVRQADLLDCLNDQAPLSTLQSHFELRAVNGEAHFIDALKWVMETGAEVVPVVSQNQYIGSILSHDLLVQVGQFIGATERGAFLVLEMESRQFSLSEISRLVETNGANILQLHTQTDPQTGMLLVAIKLNRLEIADIVATFQRYEYHIRYYAGEERFENELKSNFDHLMNYLNL